jgi:hypothetical protein
MARSKVKTKKQRARLAARQAEYDKQPENKYTGQKFRRPGSNKK